MVFSVNLLRQILSTVLLSFYVAEFGIFVTQYTLSMRDYLDLFPLIVTRKAQGPFHYFDTAASSQLPRSVLEVMNDYQSQIHSNVHRGVHTLSQKATAAYEGARSDLARFINAQDECEIIFTRGATEAINLVAFSFGELAVGPGDRIVVSEMEHHANIVPWQMLCQRKGASLEVIPVTDDGELDLEQLKVKLSKPAKVLALVHVSNVLGTVNPIKQAIDLAAEAGAVSVIDGCQACGHLPIDVTALGCDFYAFSGHKMYGPTGIGVLYGRKGMLEKMPPFLGGGDMIKSVSFEKSTYADLPYKFEAGTPPIAQAVGMGAASRFLREIGWDAVRAHEDSLREQLVSVLKERGDIVLYGYPKGNGETSLGKRIGVVPFNFENIHSHDVGMILDGFGVAVRTGQHCAEPLVRRFGAESLVRASIGLYTGPEDVQALASGLDGVRKMFSG